MRNKSPVLQKRIDLLSGGVVPAVDTLAGVRVARVRVAVALALLTVREVPVAGLALVALLSVRVRETVALPCLLQMWIWL